MDLISDIIIRIKNAAESRKETVSFPHSKSSLSVLGAIERAGFVEVLTKKGKKTPRHIEAKLVYLGTTPRFKGASRISKLSKRVYRKIKDVTPVKNGFGSLMLSTSKGVLSDKEAKKENVGGEALFSIW